MVKLWFTSSSLTYRRMAHSNKRQATYVAYITGLHWSLFFPTHNSERAMCLLPKGAFLSASEAACICILLLQGSKCPFGPKKCNFWSPEETGCDVFALQGIQNDILALKGIQRTFECLIRWNVMETSCPVSLGNQKSHCYSQKCHSEPCRGSAEMHIASPGFRKNLHIDICCT